MLDTSYRIKLLQVGITIPSSTPIEKLDMIQAGLDLCELDKKDILNILNILDKNTSINQANNILIDARRSGELKRISPVKSEVNDYEIDL